MTHKKWESLPHEAQEIISNDIGISSPEEWDSLNEPEWKRFEKATSQERKGLVVMENGKIKYDDIWKGLYYRSFLASPEWKEWSDGFKMRHLMCKHCKIRPTQVPHHIIPAIKTAIAQGFLEPLKDDKNFEPLCKECHDKEPGHRNIKAVLHRKY